MLCLTNAGTKAKTFFIRYVSVQMAHVHLLQETSLRSDYLRSVRYIRTIRISLDSMDLVSSRVQWPPDAHAGRISLEAPLRDAILRDALYF